MKFRKTTIDDIYQIKPGLDFKLDDLVEIESGNREGFYIERYAPLELKPGKEYNIFKKELCGVVKYFATTNPDVNFNTIARVQAIVLTDNPLFHL